MDKTDRLRDYGLAFLLYEHGLGICGYELIRELFIVFIKLILNSYLLYGFVYVCYTKYEFVSTNHLLCWLYFTLLKITLYMCQINTLH